MTTDLVHFIDPITGEEHRVTPAVYEQMKTEALQNWNAYKLDLAKAKDEEMKWRKRLVAMLGDPKKAKGTENIPLADGYKAKIVKKQTITFNKKQDGKTTDWDAVHDAQDQMDKLGNEGSFLAERIFKWEAKFSLSEYNKLEPDNPTHAAVKKLVDSVIITKDSAPTFEIVEPK